MAATLTTEDLASMENKEIVAWMRQYPSSSPMICDYFLKKVGMTLEQVHVSFKLRQQTQVDLERETANRTHAFYKDPEYKKTIASALESYPGRGYINIKPHLREIASWFPKDAGVLEVCAGNGHSSELLRRALL